MSFVSTLEQLNLSDVMQRLEAHAKTGLLVVKQGGLWVELYFRQGRLMCIGPVRANTTLGDRLLQAGVISREALQDAMVAISGLEPSETRIAITLMDQGHVSREGLRAWATREASKVIEVLLTWTTGDIYFEEEQHPPAERLLVSLSAAALLSSAPSPAPAPPPPVRVEPVPMPVQEPPKYFAPVPETNVPPQPRITQSLIDASALAPFAAPVSAPLPEAPVPPQVPAPAPMAAPLVPPRRIDTSFMRPEMVLTPCDLSLLREQNPQLQLTPEQWRIFTRADGRTTLQMASQILVMSPEQVCQVAGELLSLGVVNVAPPLPSPIQELSPISRDLIAAGLANGSAVQFRVSGVTTTENLSPFSPVAYMETESQWGNGGNGATFIVGRGWGMPSPSQPVRSIPQQPAMVPQTQYNVYAAVGGGPRY